MLLNQESCRGSSCCYLSVFACNAYIDHVYNVLMKGYLEIYRETEEVGSTREESVSFHSTRMSRVESRVCLQRGRRCELAGQETSVGGKEPFRAATPRDDHRMMGTLSLTEQRRKLSTFCETPCLIASKELRA